MYPDVFGPRFDLDRLEGAVDWLLCGFREEALPVAGIGPEVPIRICENGWPTGPGRSEERQADVLETVLGPSTPGATSCMSLTGSCSPCAMRIRAGMTCSTASGSCTTTTRRNSGIGTFERCAASLVTYGARRRSGPGIIPISE
jgi:hypothetical protein